MRSPHSPGSEWGSAQPPPALPAPGAGSEPIKSWNKPPPLLFPKASSRPFLLLSPRPGMFFPDFGPRVSRVSSSSKPLASPFTLKHHPLLHKGQASLLEATSSPFPLRQELRTVSSPGLCTCCSPVPGIPFPFLSRSFRSLGRHYLPGSQC